MSSYRKYIKHLTVLFLIISLSSNLFFGVRLLSLQKKIASSNSVISTKVESAIRDTMHSIKGLKENKNNEELIDLQKSFQQLVLIFTNWIDLNQLKDNPNTVLMNGLSGLEALRNAVVHHLNNQYSSSNGKLTDYDILFLDKVYDQLDRLLVVYNNIEKYLKGIKTYDKDEVGLGQWASTSMEVSRLYRHSRIPNEHPKYMEQESALKEVAKKFPLLAGNFSGDIRVTEAVQIKDGVHYYEIGYYKEDEPQYLIWIDATDGSLRYFEDYTPADKSRIVSNDEALNVARKFMNRFGTYDKVVEEFSAIKDEATNNTIYAFQFTPISEDIAMVSDCIKISVSRQGGNITKYSNNFSNTQLPLIKEVIPKEDIEEKYNEQLSNMTYAGMAVVRSFYTHYRPVVAYRYSSNEKKELRKLYFDITTGNQVYEAYSVYEPLYYFTAEQNY